MASSKSGKSSGSARKSARNVESAPSSESNSAPAGVNASTAEAGPTEIPGTTATADDASASASNGADTISAMIGAAVSGEARPDLAAADAAVDAARGAVTAPPEPQNAPADPAPAPAPSVASGAIPGVGPSSAPQRRAGRPRTREYDPTTGRPIRGTRASGPAIPGTGDSAAQPRPASNGSGPAPASASGPARGKTRDAMASDIARMESELAQANAQIAAYRARENEEAIGRLAGLVGMVGQMGFGMMANRRGAHWLMSEEERNNFGQMWALAAAPYADEIAEKAPLVGAIVVTASMILPRLARDQENRERAFPAPRPEAEAAATAPAPAPAPAPVRDFAEMTPDL